MDDLLDVSRITQGKITLHRSPLDVSALVALKGGLAPDLTQEANAGDLRRLQRSLAERMIDERIVAARSAAVRLTISDADVDAEVRQTAGELGLEPTALAAELAANGSDIAVLRETHRAAQLIGRYVAEHVLGMPRSY